MKDTNKCVMIWRNNNKDNLEQEKLEEFQRNDDDCPRTLQ
jgi:hypothetical protein